MNALKHRLRRVAVISLIGGNLCLSCAADADCIGKAPGDMDCNGTINTDDISAWILGLRNPSAYFAEYGHRPAGLGAPDQMIQDFDDAEWFLCVVENGSHEGCEGEVISRTLLKNSALIPEPGSICLVLTILIWTIFPRFRLAPGL